MSGTGVVALGIEFPPDERGQQWIALKWLGKFPSLVFWPSIADLLEVHGHLGASDVRWFDSDPFDAEDQTGETPSCHGLSSAARSLDSGPNHGVGPV
ncbi:hypothetical protein [Kribbella steppae]|uniref:hypothetical protein n=1 Tax=Kribbella steppae TaxID=2512223 RepID=UPI0018EE6070|nr:hypothetical protein [Kribbella steppae]